MEARLNSTVDPRFNQLFTLLSSINSRDDQNDNSVTAASDAISAMTFFPTMCMQRNGFAGMVE
jgi:hypothetical protein